MDDKNETSNMIEDTNVLKPREEGPFLRSEKRDQFKEVQSVMVVTAPPGFDCGVSLNWAIQLRAQVNKLELQSQLGRTWENLLLEYFADAMRAPSSAPSLMANPFVRTAGQLLFSLSLARVAL